MKYLLMVGLLLIPFGGDAKIYFLPSGLLYEISDPRFISFKDLPMNLQQVSLCESGGNPRAVGPYKEIGLLQIHPLHLPTAKKLNLDLYNPNDNIKFALWLYEKEGLLPWTASKKCWLPKLASRPLITNR